MEEVVRWPDAFGDEAPETAGGRELPAETDRCRLVVGQGNAPGRHSPKALKPARRRELVDDLRAVWKVSIRRACEVLRAGRSTYHYVSRSSSQANLRQRIRDRKFLVSLSYRVAMRRKGRSGAGVRLMGFMADQFGDGCSFWTLNVLGLLPFTTLIPRPALASQDIDENP